MKVFLMFVLCQSAAPTCQVEWSEATFDRAEDCVSVAGDAVRLGIPNLEGAFCEIARKPPKPYTVAKGKLP